MKTILELLKHEDFLPSFNLIIISAPLKDSTLRTISNAAQKLSIPVIYTHSVGFYSAFSLQLPSEFPIVETHPDPASTQDLRLVNPWPELAAAIAQVEKLDEMSDHEHGHVPYILLLLRYLEDWKREHNGNPPSNYKEKTQFRDLVRAGARTSNPEGGEENYDEAIGAVLKSITQWTLGSNLRDIFGMDQCTNIKPDSDNFWIIAAAIKTFYNAHGALPLPGSLPDMKAQSADYISLQNIYKNKARQDAAEILKTVRTIEADLGSRSTPIGEKEVEIFCKNAGHVKVIQGRSIPRLEASAPQVIESIRNGLGNPESLVSVFIAFQAIDAIVNDNQEDENSATPLDDEAKWSSTIDHLLSIITENGSQPLDDETRERITKAGQEVRRAGGGELHNISSLTGGLVAQEALKVLTKQYVPLDNTCVFDGIGSRSEMFRL
jgi:amyloid beta precursor protein binding protein 1